MSAVAVVSARNEVEQLIQEILEYSDVDLAVSSGDGFFHVNLRGADEGGSDSPHCECHEEFWVVQARRWTVYLRLSNTERVQFVRKPDPHDPEHDVLYVCFVGPDGKDLVRCSFTSLYDSENRPLTRTFSRWEELRDRYGATDEIQIRNGFLVR